MINPPEFSLQDKQALPARWIARAERASITCAQILPKYVRLAQLICIGRGAATAGVDGSEFQLAWNGTKWSEVRRSIFPISKNAYILVYKHRANLRLHQYCCPTSARFTNHFLPECYHDIHYYLSPSSLSATSILRVINDRNDRITTPSSSPTTTTTTIWRENY